jgi:N-methylhydantoinase A/oxoprolinase/acetone carboxylase beta subunit
MRIGIDVGGTNTDAVLMDGRAVLAEHKSPTTADVTAGVVAGVAEVLRRAELDPTRVTAVMIGTTHFTNAVVEAKRLMPTAAVRLGLPATQALPPMTDWPERLRRALGEHVYLCHGGHEFDGRLISRIDRGELARVVDDIERKDIRTVAVSSVFSPVNAEMEQEVGDFLAERLPGLAVSLSHEIGRIGLLERENATIMNACLRELAERIVGAFHASLARMGITAPVYLSQNDGTLMSVDYAKRYPVATFASGPTNSMRGAWFLSGLGDCAVVDIGGTTSDVGVLQHGFPREATIGVEVGGVRTNFRMPDVHSFGLGGGSIVRQDGGLAIGPDSVGYEITSRARVFGGDVLTTTDLAVAGGLADIGNPMLVKDLEPGLVKEGLTRIRQDVAAAIDRMKTSAGDIPVVVVGGGSVLLPDRLPGALEVRKPEHFAVANAIGAAIAQVGSEVDRIVSLDQLSRDDALAAARDEAVDKAVAAGADGGTVQVVDVEEVPLAYLPSNAVRVRVKAVGELRLEERSLAVDR